MRYRALALPKMTDKIDFGWMDVPKHYQHSIYVDKIKRTEFGLTNICIKCLQKIQDNQSIPLKIVRTYYPFTGDYDYRQQLTCEHIEGK